MWSRCARSSASKKRGLLADYDFVFTGNLEDYRNPEYINELKAIMETEPVAGSIRLLGFVERTEQLCIMKNAAFIVQPSLCEGWGTGAGGRQGVR